MYRDARLSVEAKIGALEEELAEVESELEVLRAKRKPPVYLLLPLFEDFWGSFAALKPKGGSPLNYVFLGPIFCVALALTSIFFLPKALMTIGIRAKRGAIRKARRRRNGLQRKLAGERRTLHALGDGDES